ncbi:M36 family metallopeptidase [Streptomyces sp. OK228]|uniref:M36 family metallopeptidase n=1 Tax=Streptomyces sp. OK228 TaxID=1882786 RepID=UPI0015CF0187|nr:M36 family metallopeptidase [Streptomyces sp. OK228]
MTDVFGFPGVEPPNSLIKKLEQTVGGTWTPLAGDDAFFLEGREVIEAATTEPVGAFAATPTASEATNSAVDAILKPDPMAEDYEISNVIESTIGRHEYRQQLVDGAPVVGGQYGIHWTLNGTMTFTGLPVGDLENRDPGIRPHRSHEEVRQAMRQVLELSKRARIDLELVVFPIHGRGIWAYKGKSVLRNPPADLRIYLKADDLTLMLSHDITCSSSYGEASLYPVSPLRTPYLRPTLLEGLDSVQGNGFSGSLIAVSRGGGTIPPMTSTHDYRMAPSDPGFEEVSAYHYACDAAGWFAQKLGPDIFSGHPFKPLKVVTNDRQVSSFTVAVYYPSSGEVHLSSSRRRNPALSADIVRHEFAHAMADRICQLNRSASIEAKVLSEGFADYCTCSALDDPRFGDYVKDEPNGARNCSDSAVKFMRPFSTANMYSNGTAWASILWDLRSELGPGVADMLATHSMYYLDSGATVESARAALLQTDRELFPSATNGNAGRHEQVINDHYKARLP